MSDIGFYEEEVLRLRRKEERLRLELQEIQREILSNAEAARNEIQNGLGTTGDPLKDLIILVHGFDEALEKQYRHLQDALKGKKGEFVLLTFITQIPTKYGLTVETRLASFYRLGVLEGEELIKGIGTFVDPITLPVSRYLEGEREFILSAEDLPELRVKKKNIFDSADHLQGGYLPLYDLIRDNIWSECLIIGDEAVKEWLGKNSMPGLYKPAADALSKLILELTD